MSAAGGGKSYAIIMEPLRHIENPHFGAVIFRQNNNQIFATGGLWDTAFEIYPHAGGRPVKTPSPMWRFPSGMKVTFAHLEMDKNVFSWQGSQIPMIGFDELTHFSRTQFFYMLSRNRTTCGVKPYVRATCNPQKDSWVREFIDWWIDPNTGYAIPERSGVIRWMVRVSDEIFWGDSPQELVEKTGCAVEDAKSVTFIASTLQDNKILMDNDPSYIANLKALSTVERERLLYGNWNVMPAAGMYFKRGKVNMVEEIPNDVVQWVRAWDLASTEEKKNNNPENGPAYTAGVLMGRRRCGRFIVVDVINKRLNAADVQALVKNTAIVDKVKYKKVRIRMNQDPGQAGVYQRDAYLKLLAGFSVNIERETGSKETRAEPLSAQWLGPEGSEMGNVDILMAEWNEMYFSQLESFPQSKFKDMTDASATAFTELTSGITYSPPPPGAGAADRTSPWRV